MPIVIQNAPIAAIANAAQVAGLGQYEARRNANLLQAQALAQQDQHFRQNLAAHLFQQQQQNLANQNSQLFQAAKQADILRWGRQNELADQQQRRGWQEADMGQQRGWHVEDLNKQFAQADKAREDAQREAQQQFEKQQQALWERQSAEQTETNIDGTMKHIADNLDLLPPEAQKEFQNHYNNWNAIKSDRAVQANPRAYGEAMQKFGQDFGKAGIASRMKPRLNTAEQFSEETFTSPGVGIVGRDRSGAWRKIADDPISDFVQKNLRYYQDEDKNVDMPAMMRDAHNYAAGIAAMHNGGPVPPMPAGPATAKKAATFDEYWSKLPRKDREQHFKDASTELMKGDRISPPTPEEVMDRVRQNMTAVHGFGVHQPSSTEKYDPRAVAAYNDMQQRLGAGWKSWTNEPGETAKHGSGLSIRDRWRLGDNVGVRAAPVHPDRIAPPPQQATPTTPVGAQPAAPADQLAPHQKPLTIAAPHPQTMEEVMTLPPGTVFIWTDGSMRKVPAR